MMGPRANAVAPTMPKTLTEDGGSFVYGGVQDVPALKTLGSSMSPIGRSMASFFGGAMRITFTAFLLAAGLLLSVGSTYVSSSGSLIVKKGTVPDTDGQCTEEQARDHAQRTCSKMGLPMTGFKFRSGEPCKIDFKCTK
jgi:hypothetical protein